MDAKPISHLVGPTVYIKTHSSVSAAKKTKEDVRHTIIYWYLKIQPSISPKLLCQFLPNLYTFCLTYTLHHISKLKEIALVVLKIFVPENCPIFFTFFFLHKIANIFMPCKNNILTLQFLIYLEH